jgi:hypothetical protein
MEPIFDDIIKGKLANYTAPIPEGLWDKLHAQYNPTNEAAFDGFVKHTFDNYSTTTPSHLWDHISTAIIPEETKHFDAFVKDRLSDYIAPVPANMWDRVKPEEEEEDKRRFFFLLPRAGMVAASILLLILAGTVSAYLYYQRLQNESVETSTNPQQPTNNKENSIVVTQDNSPKDEASNTITTPSSTNNEKAFSSANNSLNLSKASTQQSVYNGINSIPHTFNNKQQEESLLNLQNNLPITNYEDEYTATKRENGAYFFQNKKSLKSFNEKTISDNNHTSGIKNVVICPSDRKTINPDWDLEVFAGPNYGIKSISANTASPAYMAKKDSSEKAGVGFTAGFNIVKPLNDRLLLKTGLQYTQVNEKFTYRTENEVRTTTVVSVRTIIRAPGDTVIVRDTSTLQQIGFKNNTVKNRYRSIDIPVIMGYRFGNDDLSIGINAGVIVNLSSWYQGVILDTSLTAVPITKTATENVYKNNIGLGLYGSISIAKKINYSTYIFAEPFVRYNIGNTTTNNAPFNQRFTIGGLAVGLRFNLNSR